jgi:fibronectin type 3 domain-containing protein
MKTNIHIYLSLFLFLISGFSTVSAQQTDSVGVQLQVHPGKDRIYLRWLIDDAFTWSKSLKTGYTIERYTIKRNGRILPEPEKKILTASPLSAAPEEEWEASALQNQYAAILAQALFGEDFEVTGFNSGNPVSDLINASDAAKQRYSFALYAADLCFECACLAGWGYEDKDVLPGEFYLYRVIPTGLLELGFPVRYGFRYTGVDEYNELPRPIDLKAEFGDKSVQIYWNTSLYREIFTAYQIEKSEDNVRYETLGMPYTPLDDRPYIMYADSLSENDKFYYYRVRGLTIFGEHSEPSDTLSGKGAEVLQTVPVISRTAILESGAAEIEWIFDEAGNHLIRSFDLIRADVESGPYETVHAAIPPETRSVTYLGLKPSNYFRIAANSLSGKQTRSYPVLLMPVDSIPPDAPQHLTAIADTTGLVYLKWNANKEADLNGYKIFRGNREGEELIPLMSNLLKGTQYVDTVNLMNLNTHVYYAAIALDNRYNQSAFSEIIAVEKPLKVKPSPPLFVNFESESDGISLRWIPSPEPEVALHTLYRREENATENKALKIFPKADTTTVYRDSETEGGKVYIYTLTASSKWKVESNPSPEFRVSALPSGRIQALKNLQASIDREKKQIRIRWTSAAQGKVKNWKIYRSENENKLSLWKELAVEETTLWDNLELKVGNTYHYMVMAVMNDGGISNQEQTSIIY